MRLLRNHLKKCILVCFGLLVSQNSVFSFQIENSESFLIPYQERNPANVAKIEKESSVVYSFPLLSFPEKDLVDKLLEKFHQVEGFISLSVNAQNEVMLVTTKNITEKECSHLLMISTRLYGYIGYQIIR